MGKKIPSGNSGGGGDGCFGVIAALMIMFVLTGAGIAVSTFIH